MNPGIFINGQWSDRGTPVPNMNPSDTKDVIGEYAWGSVADVEAAGAAARDALPGWTASLPEARARILRKAGDLTMDRVDELARIMSREQGKTLAEARAEVIRSAEIFHYFAGEALRNHGIFTPGLRDGFTVSISREAVGVVAVITPWNLPMSIPVWKIAPAIAYGCTMVFKPSELTPGCAEAIVRILAEAGLPGGVLNMVMGNGRDLGPALIDACDAVTFTGSGPTGSSVVAAAAGQMKKVQAELGGKSGLVVHKDCDMNLAVEVAYNGAYFGTGQRCTASSRIIVFEDILDEFQDRLIKRMRQARIGDALDPATDIGPVVDDRQLSKDMGYIDIAVAEGGEVLEGGARLQLSKPGYYLQPCLISAQDNKARINQEEVFGPVASLMSVRDLDEAIATANDVHFALSSGIMTNSLRAAEQFRKQSRAAMVTINAPTAGQDFHVPFGGRSPSGYGAREQGISAIDFYTEYKVCHTNVSGEI